MDGWSQLGAGKQTSVSRGRDVVVGRLKARWLGNAVQAQAGERLRLWLRNCR